MPGEPKLAERSEAVARRLAFAAVLGLRTMDRIEAPALTHFSRDTPGENTYVWSFFEEIDTQGMLVCRDSMGCRLSVEPDRVRDMRPGKPVRVMALPKKAFMQLLARPLRESRLPTPAEMFQPGILTCISRYKQEHPTCGKVIFDDPAHRDSGEFAAHLSDVDYGRLPEIARSGAVPIRSASSRRFDASSGEPHEERRIERVAAAFFACSLAGDRHATARIAADGAARVTEPAARKLSSDARQASPGRGLAGAQAPASKAAQANQDTDAAESRSGASTVGLACELDCL